MYQAALQAESLGNYDEALELYLEILEIDVQQEVEDRWHDSTNVFSLLLASTGIQDALAEDLVLMPGMEDLITLLYLNRHAHDDRYDLIIIDCPPSLGLLTVNAFAAADELMIPIQCEYYALEGLSQLLKNVDLVRSNLNPDLTTGGGSVGNCGYS